MSGSLFLGRLFGIPLRVHWTFSILIAWLVYFHWSRGHDLNGTIEGIVFVLAVFGCVVLHELGHALMARRFGVATSDITLLPIGGVARLQRIPEKPAQELQVALAGPAVNVAIVLGLLLAGVRLPNFQAMTPESMAAIGFWPQLLMVNGFLVVFNMLPAFPMDGGRVLRALLAMGLDYTRATRLAARIGQMMAILFGFAGLSGQNPFLLLIALFVWIGAEAEAVQVQERFSLRNVPLRRAIVTEFHTLSPDEPMSRAADLLLAGTQEDFPVMAGGQPAGILTRQALIQAIAAGGMERPVSQAPLLDLEQIDIDQPLLPAVARLRETRSPCMMVTEYGEPAGLLTNANIAELVMIRTAQEAALQRG